MGISYFFYFFLPFLPLIPESLGRISPLYNSSFTEQIGVVHVPIKYALSVVKY